LACCGCTDSDCDNAEQALEEYHQTMRDNTKQEFDDDLDALKDWWIEILFNREVVPAMAAMVTQMTAASVQYTEVIGGFLDAQTQMDTQRLLRVMQLQAHKDYRPSQNFCMFGTNVRSLAATENKARYNTLALSQISLSRQLGNINLSGAEGVSNDYKSRWEQFITTYCDIRDNNYQDYGIILGVSAPAEQTGLALACDHDGAIGGTAGAEDPNRINRDIDYTRLIENPRTLDVDFTNATLDSENPQIILPIREPGEEEDVIALSKNLYGHRVLSRSLSQTMMSSGTAQKLYLALRSVAARRNVAQASFNAIVGLKSAGTSREPSGVAVLASVSPVTHVLELGQTQRYLASIVSHLLPATSSIPGFEGRNIFDLIGHSPSYYSQLEIMAKRIYQNPDFYANLYETPVNVARKKVAMQAIGLMVDRAIYESQLRREMNISVLLSSKLRATHRTANNGLSVSVTE